MADAHVQVRVSERTWGFNSPSPTGRGRHVFAELANPVASVLSGARPPGPAGGAFAPGPPCACVLRCALASGFSWFGFGQSLCSCSSWALPSLDVWGSGWLLCWWCLSRPGGLIFECKRIVNCVGLGAGSGVVGRGRSAIWSRGWGPVGRSVLVGVRGVVALRD